MSCDQKKTFINGQQGVSIVIKKHILKPNTLVQQFVYHDQTTFSLKKISERVMPSNFDNYEKYQSQV